MLWFLLACLLVLPVALRVLVGDEDPDNAIRHEQENQSPQEPDAPLAVAGGNHSSNAPSAPFPVPWLCWDYVSDFQVQEVCGPYA